MQFGMQPIALRTLEIWFERKRALVGAQRFVKLAEL
jgi:hypothetical protein